MSRIQIFALSLLLMVGLVQPRHVEALSLPSAAESQPQSASADNPAFVAAAFNHDGCRVFQQWVIRNLTFPLGQFFAGQEVYAYVRFEVTKSGKVRNVEVKSPASPCFGERVAEVVAASPLWTPEVKAGKKAESVHQLPLSLKLHLNDRGALYAEDIQVYAAAEQMPRFEGGASKALSRWITSRVGNVFPNGRPISLNASVSMVVEKDGSISNVKVARTGSEWLMQRIQMTIRQAPRFTPAVHFGDTVRVRIGLKLRFAPAGQLPADTLTTVSVAPSEDKFEPFLVVEKMPRFRGGDLSVFRSWVSQNLSYPREAMDFRIEGRVLLSFVVEKDGSVSNITLLESPNTLLSEAAIAVVEKSPKWQPGMQEGKTVRVRYTLPLDFRLTKPAENAPMQRSSSRFGAPVAGQHDR